jgi:hypothetical protein
LLDCLPGHGIKKQCSGPIRRTVSRSGRATVLGRRTVARSGNDQNLSIGQKCCMDRIDGNSAR